MLLISFFIVQCYASMVFAMALHLSVFVAVASRSSTKMAKYIRVGFWYGNFLPSVIHFVVDIRVSPERKVLPCGT